MLVSGVSGLPIQHWHDKPSIRPENNVNHSSDFNIRLDSNLLKLLINSISSGVSLKASNIYFTLYSFTCRVLKCDLHMPENKKVPRKAQIKVYKIIESLK